MRTATLAILLSVPAAAAGADPATDDATTGSWSTLDQELVHLSTASLQNGGPTIGGYVRTHYQSSSDEAFGASSGMDVGGWTFRAVRLEAKGTVGEDYSWKVSFDGAKNSDGEGLGGEFVVKDAYADFAFHDAVTLRWGQFKEPLVSSGLSSGSRQLFVDRTALGGINDDRDLGAMLYGSHGDFGWNLAVQNGKDSDGILDDYLMTARATYDFCDGAFGKYQGAYGRDGGTGASVGLSWQDDGAAMGGDGDFMILELAGTHSNAWAHFEITDVDENYVGEKSGSTPFKKLIPDSTPWAFTLSYLFGDDEFEAAVRFEDADDTSDTSRIIGGINWYSTYGHNVKWQLNFVNQDSDDNSLDGTMILAGLVLRMS